MNLNVVRAKGIWEASNTVHASDPGEGVTGEDLSRKHWMTQNRLRTGVDRYKASMKKWGLAESAACECTVASQKNRQLTTSSIAAYYIDHHPKLASSKLGI